jgi:hypothetical protein
MTQLRKILYEAQGITVNLITYITNHIQYDENGGSTTVELARTASYNAEVESLQEVKFI